MPKLPAAAQDCGRCDEVFQRGAQEQNYHRIDRHILGDKKFSEELPRPILC